MGSGQLPMRAFMGSGQLPMRALAAAELATAVALKSWVMTDMAFLLTELFNPYADGVGWSCSA
jgi:hypothetical protein